MSKTSEETLQRDFIDNPNRIGKYKYYNAGATTIGSFKVSKLITNKKYKNECRKPDGLICLDKKVIAVIENKALHAYDTSEKVAGASKQAFEVAKDLGAKFVISTDTLSSEWINAYSGCPIIDELGNPIKIVFNLKTSITPPMEKLIDKLNANVSVTCNNLPQIEYVDPTPLAKQVWQMIYASTGASPENCLYTFIEMFIFKYLSDLEILTGSKSFNEFIKLYKQDSPDSVLSDYATKIRPEIKRLFPANSEDGTTIINGTIFVEPKNGTEEAKTGYGETFKAILEKFRDFGELKDIDLDFKSKVFEIFFKEDTQKGGMGQYFTPLKVVRQMVNMVDVKEGMIVCDPACGVGKFLLDTASRNLNSFYDIEGDKLTNKITLEGYDKGFTKDNERTIILAKANMMIYFSELIKNNPSMTKKFSELFNSTFHLKTSILGTLEDTPTDKYDIILSNPPYLVSGSQPIKNAIMSDTKLNTHYTKKGIGLEGLFLEWIVRALKPEGTALIIIPDGIMTRGGDSVLRQFILDECDIECIISLPINTFFTTNKKTFIICLKKKKKKDKSKQIQPVFTYLISSIGETLDVNRFEIDENDLDDAQYQYRVFKMDKDKYKPNSKRCKIVPIDKLYTDVKFSWFINNYWTDEEKIELGIKNETTVVSLSEFETFIGDVSTELNIYKDMIVDVSSSLDFPTTTYSLNDIIDFTIKTNNSKFTKKFVNSYSGDIPVYGATMSENLASYGYVQDNLEGIKYFENCLTWNIDGSMGNVHKRTGRFSLSEKVIPLIIKKEYTDCLLLDYLQIEIGEKLAFMDFNFTNKAGKGKIQNINIEIPIKEDKTIDIEAQKIIADRYNIIGNLKKEIENKLNELKMTEIKTFNY